MNFYNSVDISIYSVLILAVIIVHSISKTESLSLSGRYRILLALSIGAILLCDILASIHYPTDWSGTHLLKYLLFYVYFLLQPLPVSLGLMYLFSLFREKRFSVFQHFLFLIPVLVGSILMAVSLFTNFVFYIDADNIYHRGPGMFIFGIINYSYIIPSAGLVIYYRDRIKRRTLLSVIAFTMIPFIGSFLQLCYYGIITAWPSFTLALLIIYLFLESRKTDRDYLTGLLNRQSFEARVYGRIAQYDKKGAFTLVVADLDKFKQINDQLGHEKGDEVLQAAADILSQSLSASDTVARFGGDEFIMILETNSSNTVDKILARIDQNIGKWNHENDNSPMLSLSAGYAMYDPAKHQGYEDLFRQADMAMFEKKDSSTSRYS